jgi:hypothetical protein
MGLEEKSVIQLIVFAAISIPAIWFSLFWIRVLFIPSSRGKLSIFSPIVTSSCQISFRNDDLIPIIAGSWLTIWLFLVTIGWSIAIRQEPVLYKSGHRLTSFPNCCQKIAKSDQFENWFETDYLPKILQRQRLAVAQRRFIVFQSSPSRAMHEQIGGLFTAFAFAMISGRELLVDWPPEMSAVLQTPGWEWDYSKIFRKKPITPAILDLVAPPSYIVPPAHKWKWADILQENITSKILGDDLVILVDCDDFLAPFLWLNRHYRSFLCGLCNIDEIHEKFGKVLLQWNDRVVQASNEIIKIMGESPVVLVADSKIASRQKLKQMTDTMMRCADASNHGKVPWLVLRNGGGLSSFPPWDMIGHHKQFFFESFNSLKNMNTLEEKAAVLYCMANVSKAVIGFTGSAIAESLAYAVGAPLYLVLHRTPFCGEVPIRIPCIKKWNSVLNSPAINLSKFMSAEMTNMLKCRV